MTNGENLKNIYPDLEIIREVKDVYVIMLETHNVCSPKLEVFKSWWNAEYKEPSSSEKPNKSEIPTGSTTNNDLPHCQCTDAEIAKSFIEDVEAVKDQLPCGEQMDFPNTFDEFAKDYGFKDKDEIYTNGIELISVYRVKQWLEHISTTKNDLAVREFEEIVVEYPPEDLCTYPEYRGKPYFSIKYKEGNDCFIGYGTYNPKVFSRYLRDYFMPSVTQQEPRCRECKWWKDSDGKYRRGLGAESQCPINTHAVYSGEGYCYKFSPKADMRGEE